MRHNKSKKGKSKRPHLVKPDEAFSYGPIQIARFGEKVILQSNWKEGDFAKMQSRLVDQYPIVVNDINVLIEHIENLVKVLPPGELLLRAWWGYDMSALKKDDIERHLEDPSAIRMIDYIQSIIASTTPSVKQKDKISDEDWVELCRYVDELFQKLNGQFHICANAKRKNENNDYNKDLEDFSFKSQLYWCNVRGNRYPVHQLNALGELIIPQSAIIKEVFGISSEALIKELAKVWDSLIFGFIKALDEMDRIREVTMNAMKTDIDTGIIDSKLDGIEMMAETLKHHGLNQDVGSVLGKCFGLDLFDLQKLTNLPKSFLEKFSWAQGQDTEFSSEGEFKRWPLRIWPTFKRPFIMIDERYYCFDLNSLFDNFYRQTEKKIFSHSELLKQKWIKNRKDVSETLPLKYFQEILPSSTVTKGVYYKWTVGSGIQKEWCEADALISYDDNLFIIEIKAGAFTYTSPAEDLPAYVNSLKNLVLSPAIQGRRFLDYLYSGEQVSIYDESHNELRKIRKSDYRNITLCTITQVPFTEIAAQIQSLNEIGISIGKAPIWALSIDDLQAYSDIFKSPLEFLHYVEQRIRAFDSQVLNLNDELDHLGLYLKHNNYSKYAKDMANNNSVNINFLGYRDKIDDYFHNQLQNSECLTQLSQEMPSRLREFINYLNSSNKPGRSSVASYLLDISGDWRKWAFNKIEDELRSISSTKRMRTLSTQGEVRLTIFPWSIPLAIRDEAYAAEHTKALIVLNKEKNRLLVEPTYNGSEELIALDWHFIHINDISNDELGELTKKAELIGEKRVAKAKSELGKIGRNDPCPCGSGKKYKRCHL